ncbi:threonine/serine exporter family protein [Levilactobacillus bambusae]|uniref:Threonine/serine exporter n=1 Tax=Levilactobacillus bambusae TaxID=2024736 RepID=A0A2V1MZS9_9LACO|nr:threonine/serine exporter family protein [Levilactobacillus bambusae]PWF99997.1 threonine/serine exporter [Levilactobacillus bambusae]
MAFLISIVATYAATVSFGILINIPRRALNVSGLIGVLAWVIYSGIVQIGGGSVTGNLIGAFVIGVASMQAARHKKMPVIIFTIPSLVPFVPGGQAYQMIKNFALGNPAVAADYLLQVVMIAGALAFGFVLSELANSLQRRYLTRQKLLKQTGIKEK